MSRLVTGIDCSLSSLARHALFIVQRITRSRSILMLRGNVRLTFERGTWRKGRPAQKPPGARPRRNCLPHLKLPLSRY